MMAQAKITTKGQVTIPLAVRRRLGIGPGDEIEFRETKKGFLLAKRVSASPFEKYVGYLKKKRGQNPDKIVEELRGM
jgi:AbrB family looped-hinge helix DNA binding protein